MIHTYLDIVNRQRFVFVSVEHIQNAVPDENVSELEMLSANLSFDLPDIGANADINMEDFADDILDLDAIGREIELKLLAKDVAHKSKKAERPKIIIPDYEENGNVSVPLPFPLPLEPTADDFEMSDEDFQDDQPCGMDALILPNSNTDRNAVDVMKSNCSLCSYQATKGWKQLTKHYVRKHPGNEISISRLANVFNPQELNETTFTPIITKQLSETMIQSLCYICNEGYNMSSSKWLMHFIAHTGKSMFDDKMA